MKQVIVVNSALGLPPGKMAAQVAHAAVGAFLRASRSQQRLWLEAGMPKVVLSSASESAMLAIHREAKVAGLPVALVRDAGRTVVQPGTATCVGIGPDSSDKIDTITGNLALAP
jgi:peptidyl-tRNA hydrolase, PTH2 family